MNILYNLLHRLLLKVYSPNQNYKNIESTHCQNNKKTFFNNGSKWIQHFSCSSRYRYAKSLLFLNSHYNFFLHINHSNLCCDLVFISPTLVPSSCCFWRASNRWWWIKSGGGKLSKAVCWLMFVTIKSGGSAKKFFSFSRDTYGCTSNSLCLRVTCEKNLRKKDAPKMNRVLYFAVIALIGEYRINIHLLAIYKYMT